MQSGTLAALGYPLRKQIPVIADPLLLGTAQLNGLLLVDTIAEGGDINLILPEGISINPGGFYQVVLARATQVQSAILNFLPGNTYNGGQTSPLSINSLNAGIIVIAGTGSTWIVVSNPSVVNNLELGPFQGGSFGVPGYYSLGAPETLPPAASSTGPFHVVNTTGGPLLISITGADSLTSNTGVGGPIAVGPGATMSFKSDGVSAWQQF